MVLMRKGNRQIRTDEARREEYLKRGYDELDESGRILTRGNSGISAAAQAEPDALRAENEALRAEVGASADNSKKK